ncbi:MAG: hypothetical protein K8T89_25890, partial [Planctomycetes bacterium]|nr:hypothetical protein [Planctomycetota bacterium]
AILQHALISMRRACDDAGSILCIGFGSYCLAYFDGARTCQGSCSALSGETNGVEISAAD